ncbi:hypothetical protein JOQ06_005602 [Pogonophryne albipinna]|uniref:Uncharacterized protein n=1 Tax=Pogonophryne albipinna TaxID=1090488 RepID=A0AAD6BG15_9TELE|nr:hypothetical protein JOQ06_005602 [Pogonophryne albipinna]
MKHTSIGLSPMFELSVSPDAHGEPWSSGCGIFRLISSAQSSEEACRFLPAKFINPASGSDCETHAVWYPNPSRLVFTAKAADDHKYLVL